MKYVLKKSIEFPDLVNNKKVFIPAGVIVTLDISLMVAYYADYHFYVERHEVTALQ